jgi:LPXTG-site transpeptidase (sortase) family protein
MLLTGLLVVATPEAVATAAPGRTITAAPVVRPPAAAPTSAGVAASSDPTDATVQEAATGRAEGVRDPFRPASLELWGGDRAPVVPAGVRDDGSLIVPDDPAQVGWWTGGAQAGEAFGRIVIAGHVDSARLGIGVLADLRGARAGRVVTLRLGDRVQRYKVTGVQEVKQADLAADPAIFAQDGAHRLVLITCGGRFDRTTHRYESNLIVEAVPVA